MSLKRAQHSLRFGDVMKTLEKLQGLSCLTSMYLSSSTSLTVQTSERAVCYRAIASLVRHKLMCAAKEMAGHCMSWRVPEGSVMEKESNLL